MHIFTIFIKKKTLSLFDWTEVNPFVANFFSQGKKIPRRSFEIESNLLTAYRVTACDIEYF